MPLSVLFADDWVVAIDKPSGLVVHRGWADDDITVVDLAKAQLGPLWSVHRLDRGTSGVLLFGRSAAAADGLHRQLASGTAEKCYWAFVRGVPPEEVVIDHPIPNKPDGPRVPAVTVVRRLWRGEHCALVEARPRTGRLHQIRRHLKHISHPLIGDATYGKGALNREYKARVGLGRLALHARRLRLLHPSSGATLDLSAPLPADLVTPLLALGVPQAVLEAAACEGPGASP